MNGDNAETSTLVLPRRAFKKTGFGMVMMVKENVKLIID